MQTFNWGILAPGNIAAKFATGLNSIDSANLHSVASRDVNRARQFAQQHGCDKVANDYAELINDPAVDIIYIASPHSFHFEHSLRCIQAGKAVVCEKPMTVNATQAEQIEAAALANNTFYMEAVWSRFMPSYKRVRKWIDSGAIGEVKMVQANFGFGFPFDPHGRLFDINLAGGALLDLGIYPITFAQWVMGDPTPEAISAVGHLGTTGVDENLAINIKYSGGAVAALTSSVLADTDYNGWIIGTEGKIKVPAFWCAQSAELIKSQRLEATVIERFEQPYDCNGYEYEIKEVHRCLEHRAQQSAILPISHSVRVMRIMDEVRAQIGLKYPFET